MSHVRGEERRVCRRPPDANRHQGEQAGAPGGQLGSVGQRAWQGLAQPLLGGEVNEREGRSWRMGRREAVKAGGWGGDILEEAAGQRSFGLDTKAPWAWAALPKHTEAWAGQHWRGAAAR